MEEAIEYIWEWNEKYGVGFIKITNQKHIGTELYKGEREYIAKNGIHIRSESYPDAGGDTLFVWGSDTTLNERTIIWRNFKEFDRCVAAINEYNQVHRLKCSICNKVLNDTCRFSLFAERLGGGDCMAERDARNGERRQNMKALKEDMSEEIANIPEELLKKAYSIDFSIIDGEVARLKVQGSYDSDVVKKYYQRAVISAGGYVEFRVGGIYCVMT